jgi:hypothetical protein
MAFEYLNVVFEYHIGQLGRCVQVFDVQSL